MESKPIIEFFSNSTLKGAFFYYYCPNMKEKDKSLITNLINNYEGKIVSKITKNTIIIVESEESIKSQKFLKLIDNYGDIYFSDNNHIEIIKHNSKKNKLIKIITFKELLLEVAAFDDKTINYFYERGLTKNINPEAIISLIFNINRNKTKIESYDFSYQDNNKNIFYDIPYLHSGVPQGFSVFCTDEEYNLVLNHVNKAGYQMKQKKKNKSIEEPITPEPEPTKKNYVCQLCRVTFNNYKEHITSKTHLDNINDNKNAFNKLSSTFKRIAHNNFNKPKETKITKISLNKPKASSSKLNIVLEKIKMKDKTNYNLRNKNIIIPGKQTNNINTTNYFALIRKNNKIMDINSPPQQVSSTASCTFKNGLTSLEEIFDSQKNNGNLNNFTKRKRNREKELFINEEIYFKNKKSKI